MIGQSRPLRDLLAPALAVVLAGCAGTKPAGPTGPLSRTYDRERAAVMADIESFLEQTDIEVTAVDRDRGLIRGRQAPLRQSDWAACDDRVISDSEGERRRHVDPENARLELAVDVRAQGGQTRVSVDPAFAATYHDSFINRDFEADCPSTGTLEQALLQAI